MIIYIVLTSVAKLREASQPALSIESESSITRTTSSLTKQVMDPQVAAGLKIETSVTGVKIELGKKYSSVTAALVKEALTI